MISDAIKLIRLYLKSYILEVEPDLELGEAVLVQNIAMAEELGGTNNQLTGHVIMSLVNVQEESALKNVPAYQTINGQTIYKNPPVHVNLFI